MSDPDGTRSHCEPDGTQRRPERTDRLRELIRLNRLISSSLDRDAALSEIARSAASLAVATGDAGRRPTARAPHASGMQELCARLEALGQAGSTDGATELAEALEAEYERVRRALEPVRQDAIGAAPA